jgi:hypothetical protein
MNAGETPGMPHRGGYSGTAGPAHSEARGGAPALSSSALDSNLILRLSVMVDQLQAYVINQSTADAARITALTEKLDLIVSAIEQIGPAVMGPILGAAQAAKPAKED